MRPQMFREAWLGKPKTSGSELNKVEEIVPEMI